MSITSAGSTAAIRAVPVVDRRSTQRSGPQRAVTCRRLDAPVVVATDREPWRTEMTQATGELRPLGFGAVVGVPPVSKTRSGCRPISLIPIERRTIHVDVDSLAVCDAVRGHRGDQPVRHIAGSRQSSGKLGSWLTGAALKPTTAGWSLRSTTSMFGSPAASCGARRSHPKPRYLPTCSPKAPSWTYLRELVSSPPGR